jgi:hypothetical protein
MIHFSPPSWNNCVEYFEGVGYSMMSYFDSVASPTYSEFAIARYIEESSIKDLFSFEKYLKKKALKNLLDEEDELVDQDTLELKLPGKFSRVLYIEAKDLNAGNKGKADYLLVRSVFSVLVVEKENKQKVYEFIYSERGKPEELWNRKDFTCRAEDFLSTIQLH